MRELLFQDSGISLHISDDNEYVLTVSEQANIDAKIFLEEALSHVLNAYVEGRTVVLCEQIEASDSKKAVKISPVCWLHGGNYRAMNVKGEYLQ